MTGGYGAAGIGAGYESHIGNITINGGNVTVTGGTNAAGIGCGYYAKGDYSCGNITFNGGTVVVNAGTNGWGVGSKNSKNYSCGNINFVGGSVTVKGRIETKNPSGIFIDGVEQQNSYIDATAQSPFVYPVPVNP